MNQLIQQIVVFLAVAEILQFHKSLIGKDADDDALAARGGQDGDAQIDLLAPNFYTRPSVLGKAPLRSSSSST